MPITVERAAREYCKAYNAYQLEFARERLKKTLNQVTSEPSHETISTYAKMIAAYDQLHEAALGHARPNYVEQAKAELETKQ